MTCDEFNGQFKFSSGSGCFYANILWLVSCNTVSYTQPHRFSQNSCGASGFYHSEYRRYNYLIYPLFHGVSMNQRYNVPAIHTATFPAHLTENFSHSPQTCSDIIRAAERRTQNALLKFAKNISFAVLLLIAMLTSPLKSYSQSPTVIFNYPMNNATNVSFRPVIRLKTHYKIVTNSIVHNMYDRDSLDTSLPTALLVPKIIADSLPILVKYTSTLGAYTFVNDTTLEFQPYGELLPLTKYLLIIGTLKVCMPKITGPGYDTVEVQHDTISFTTVNLAYGLVAASYIHKGYTLCGDTLSLQFNRKLLSSTSPLDSALIIMKRYDSTEVINDSTSIPHTTPVPLTVWVDPSDSTILRALPDSTYIPGNRYYVTAKVSELSGEPDDDITSFLVQKSYYQVSMNSKSYDTSYSVPSYCTVYPADKSNYTLGDTVTIHAQADSNFLFLRWESKDVPSIDSSTISTLQLPAVTSCHLLSDIALTAVFIRKDTVTVTVGDTTNLTVAVYNDTNGYLGGAGTYQLAPDQTITTVATPDSGYAFTKWNAQSIGQVPSIEERSEKRVTWRNNGTNILVNTEGPTTLFAPCYVTKLCVHVVAADENNKPCNPKGNRDKTYSSQKIENLYSSHVNPMDIVDIYIDGVQQSGMPACKEKPIGYPNPNWNFNVIIRIKTGYTDCWTIGGHYYGPEAENEQKLHPDGEEDDPLTVWDETKEFRGTFAGSCPNPNHFSLILKPKTRKLTVITDLVFKSAEWSRLIGLWTNIEAEQNSVQLDKEVIVRVWKECRVDLLPINPNVPPPPPQFEWVDITQDAIVQNFNLPCNTRVKVMVDWIEKEEDNLDFSFVEWKCTGEGKKWRHPYGSCPPFEPDHNEFVFVMDDNDLYVKGIAREAFRLQRVHLIEDNGGATPNKTYRPQKLDKDRLAGHIHRDLNITHYQVPQKVTRIDFRFSHAFTPSSISGTSNIECKETPEPQDPRIDWDAHGHSPSTLTYKPINGFNAICPNGIGSDIVNFNLSTMRGSGADAVRDGIPHAKEFTTKVKSGITLNSNPLIHLYKEYSFLFETEMPGLDIFLKEITPLEKSGLDDGNNIELFSYADATVMNNGKEIAAGYGNGYVNKPMCQQCGVNIDLTNNHLCYEIVEVGSTLNYGMNEGSRILRMDKMRKNDIVSAWAISYDYDGTGYECWDVHFTSDNQRPTRLFRDPIRTECVAYSLGALGVGSIVSAIVDGAASGIGSAWAASQTLFLPLLGFALAIALAWMIFYFTVLRTDHDDLGKTTWGYYDWYRQKFGGHRRIDGNPKTDGIIKHVVRFRLNNSRDIPPPP